MFGGITVAIELAIIIALAWLARWALDQANYFGRLCKIFAEENERFRHPPRDSRGRFSGRGVK